MWCCLNAKQPPRAGGSTVDLRERQQRHDDCSRYCFPCEAIVLAQIPVTPGALGFVEAGLMAMLVLAGVGAADAALATLAYRLASYWLPLPAGAAAWGIHAWRYRDRPAAED